MAFHSINVKGKTKEENELETVKAIKLIIIDPTYVDSDTSYTLPSSVGVYFEDDDGDIQGIYSFEYDEKRNIVKASTNSDFVPSPEFLLKYPDILDATGIKLVYENYYPPEYTMGWEIYLVE